MSSEALAEEDRGAGPYRRRTTDGAMPLMGRKWMSLFLACGVALPAHVNAGAAKDQVRKTVTEVLSILSDPRYRQPAQAAARRERLRRTLHARFDFAEMAKRSLGRHWRDLKPAEQREFVGHFTGLLERVYLRKVESFQDERVVFTRESEDGDRAQIDSRVVAGPRGEFSVRYRLHRAGGEWMIYDVVIEEISLVNIYRSQFDRIVSRSSAGALLETLRRRRADGSPE